MNGQSVEHEAIEKFISTLGEQQRELTRHMIADQIEERRQAREGDPAPDARHELGFLVQVAYFAGHSHTARARIIERILLLGNEDLALLDKALGGIEEGSWWYVFPW